MKQKSNAIIVDLDGVLCNHSHRIHYVDPAKDRTLVKGIGEQYGKYFNPDGTKWEANYAKFYEKMPEDKLNTWCALILEAYDGDVIFITGRPELYDTATVRWLDDHLQLKNDWVLYMRPTYRTDIVGTALPPIKVFDTRPADEYKERVYLREIAHQYDIDFVLEDNFKCVEMYRSMGLICLDVGRK